MSENVRLLHIEGKPVAPNTLLEVAKNANLATVAIVGLCENGELYVSGSDLDAQKVHWLLSLAAHKIVNGDFGGF